MQENRMDYIYNFSHSYARIRPDQSFDQIILMKLSDVMTISAMRASFALLLLASFGQSLRRPRIFRQKKRFEDEKVWPAHKASNVYNYRTSAERLKAPATPTYTYSTLWYVLFSNITRSHVGDCNQIFSFILTVRLCTFFILPSIASLFFNFLKPL